jgi:dihydrofolate reductase
MGRNTYELGVRQGITSPYAPLRQYVVSRSMRESPDATVELRRGDPLGLVRSLKAENGMDIWLCGGAKLAAAVVGEIDELILKINPVIFGTGISLFDGLEAAIPAIPIELQTYANGFSLARYAMRSS